MNLISFDIETIPEELDSLSYIQRDVLKAKIDAYMGRNPDKDKEAARNMLMATNPYFGRIVCIGITQQFNSVIKSKGFSGPEDKLITDFWNCIADFSGIFVSFNGLGFDVPFIVGRSQKYNITPTNKNFLNLRRYSQFPHYDIMMWVANWDRYNSPSLRLLAEHLGITSPKEGDVAAENVYEAFKEGKIDEIVKYCLKDTEATLKIYNKIRKYTTR